MIPLPFVTYIGSREVPRLLTELSECLKMSKQSEIYFASQIAQEGLLCTVALAFLLPNYLLYKSPGVTCQQQRHIVELNMRVPKELVRVSPSQC